MGEAKQTKTGAGIVRTVIDDLEVTVEAILGVARLSIGELEALKTGDSMTLDALLGDPVELRLNGTVIAAGELVSVGDNFAVRITALAKS